MDRMNLNEMRYFQKRLCRMRLFAFLNYNRQTPHFVSQVGMYMDWNLNEFILLMVIS